MPIKSNNRKEKVTEHWNNLSEENQSSIYKELDTNFDLTYEDLIEMLFDYPPPTPEQFLDPNYEFLHPEVIDGFYKYIKDDFLEVANNLSDVFNITLYGGTRNGKSVLSQLLLAYTSVLLNYLRSPHAYYGVASFSPLSIYAVSFKHDKTYELIVDPVLKLISSSKRFKRHKLADSVEKYGVSKDGIINFSTASEYAAMVFPKFNLNTGRDPSSLVGANIVAGTVSELTWYREYMPGITDEKVLEVYTKLNYRIKGTIGKRKHSIGNFVILDGSARDAESPLERMILNDLSLPEKSNFYRRYVIYELRPEMYPDYQKTGKTFEVITGNADIPAKLISFDPATRTQQLKDVPIDLVEKVPIDLYKEYEKDLIGSIRDISGIPTSNESKFIQRSDLVTRIFNNDLLHNIESGVIADSSEKPEKNLWNKISNKFFSKISNKKNSIIRAPKEPRFIGIDLAHSASGDVAGFTLLHKEWSKEKQSTVYVIDFSIAVLPGLNGINLEAINQLIHDLMIEGRTNLINVSADTFNVGALKQFVEREGIIFNGQSVDKTILPYQFLLECLLSDSLKAGKNIFLKNNLLSLYRFTNAKGHEKIDHNKGHTDNKYGGDFDTSKTGINAKDVSDSVCQALYAAHDNDYPPATIYEDENQKASVRRHVESGDADKVTEKVKSIYSKDIDNAIEKLERFF